MKSDFYAQLWQVIRLHSPKVTFRWLTLHAIFLCFCSISQHAQGPDWPMCQCIHNLAFSVWAGINTITMTRSISATAALGLQ